MNDPLENFKAILAILGLSVRSALGLVAGGKINQVIAEKKMAIAGTLRTIVWTLSS